MVDDSATVTDSITAELTRVVTDAVYPCEKCAAETRLKAKEPVVGVEKRICSICREVQDVMAEAKNPPSGRGRWPCQAMVLKPKIPGRPDGEKSKQMCMRETRLHTPAVKTAAPDTRVCSKCRHEQAA